MINHHSRRIFTVGSARRGCDFATMTAAMAAMAAIGGWSALNRALLIIEGRVVESGTMNPLPFVDVHFRLGASLAFSVGNLAFNTANYDGNWSADSAATPHIVSVLNVANSIASLNLFRINATAGGTCLNLNFGAASPTVANVKATECVFTSSGGYAVLGFGPNITFDFNRCSFNATTGAINLTCNASVAHCRVISTADMAANVNFLQPLAGNVGKFDFLTITGFAAGGFGMTTITQNATQGTTLLRNSLLTAPAASNGSLAFQTGSPANARILNNTILAVSNAFIGLNSLVANVNFRAHNNVVRGTVNANWGNQAMVLNGSNIIVT